jgi:hypothetical protein
MPPMSPFHPRPRYESTADRLIREAQERGEFDNLPGEGKPIPGLDGRHDPDWWIKGLMEREQVSVLPPSIALRKQVHDLPATLAGESSETNVRAIVTSLDQIVADAHRVPLDGPQVFVRRIDVEAVVAQWRQGRRDRGQHLRP